MRAAHPRQALLTAAGMGVAAALAGRSAREVGLVAGTVLVGQVVLGWHNDLVDRRRDLAHERENKPVAAGLLDPGTVWFALACAVLALVPLAIANGVVAGLCYLLAVAIGLVGNLVLRGGWLSWLPWAASYALLPAFLSYGGWGGEARGNPPEVARHRARRAARVSGCTCWSRCPGWSPTTRTACGTCRCGSGCASARPRCWCSPPSGRPSSSRRCCWPVTPSASPSRARPDR